jgi:hypothetical protein
MRLDPCLTTVVLTAALGGACAGPVEGHDAPAPAASGSEKPAPSAPAPATEKPRGKPAPDEALPTTRYARVPLRGGDVRVPLVVLPGDAAVEVDRQLVARRDGLIDLVGAAGSTHHVVAYRGAVRRGVDVTLKANAQGVIKIDLNELEATQGTRGGKVPVRTWIYDF